MQINIGASHVDVKKYGMLTQEMYGLLTTFILVIQWLNGQQVLKFFGTIMNWVALEQLLLQQVNQVSTNIG